MDIFQKRWHSIHAKNIEKREKTSQERLRKYKFKLKETSNKASKRIHMVVPSIMHFFKNYHDTVKFIDNIKKHVFEDDKFVFLDFSKCKDISSEACVVLAAEIDRCRKKIPDSVSGSYPSNSKVYFLLNELGFFKLLKIRATPPTFDDNSEVDVVKLQSGKISPRNVTREIEGLFYTKNGEMHVTSYSRRVYPALTEAMGNALEHAYPEYFIKKKDKTCVPIWWRAGFKINKDNRVLIVLYDQGVGIPNTLHVHWREILEKRATRLGRGLRDDEKIALAMEKGRSSTKITGRGIGSYEMQSLIRESKDGLLSIFSYNGRYIYPSDGEWKKSPLPYRLDGTLVVWQISLDKEEED